MAATDFMFPAYSSTHPAIAQLFANEFAQRQASQGALESLAATDTARQQIQAQERLVQAQLRGQQQQQDQANLFRMSELQDRRAQNAQNNLLGGRQLDIMEKDVNQRGQSQIKVETERRKAQIAELNASAKTAAARFQDVYNSMLATALEDTRKKKAGYWFTTTSGAAKEMANPNDPERVAAEDKAWKDTLMLLQNDRSGVGQLIIPNMKSRTFMPALLDELGNLVAPPVLDVESTVTNVPSVTTPPATVQDVQLAPEAGLFGVGGGSVIPTYGGPGTTSFVPRPELMGMSAPPPVPMTPARTPRFNSAVEAEAANLPDGTVVEVLDPVSGTYRRALYRR